jgi:hypothetical protein
MMHLNTMTRFTIFCLPAFFLFACGQPNTAQQIIPGDVLPNNHVSFDTTLIAILPADTVNQLLFKDTSSTSITNEDLQTIDTLLTDCIKVYNIGKHATNSHSLYIDLKKYRRQYVPFLNSKGERMVFINAFCELDHFDYWKKTLVDVKDGGSCFFHVSINLTTGKYEQLYSNGYA